MPAIPTSLPGRQFGETRDRDAARQFEETPAVWGDEAGSLERRHPAVWGDKPGSLGRLSPNDNSLISSEIQALTKYVVLARQYLQIVINKTYNNKVLMQS